EHRRPPLRQKQEREARGNDREAVELAGARPGAFLLVLQADEERAAFAVPVVLTEEALPGQPADTLDAVDVVKERLVRLQIEVRFAPDPGVSAHEARILPILAAVVRGAVEVDLFPALVQLGARDVEPADPGRRHRLGAVPATVPPAAV